MRLCGYQATGVVMAAKRLGLNEFELFETAYRASFQAEGSIQLLERHFVLYLFEGHVPYWVQRYLQHLDLPLDAPLPASTWYQQTPRMLYLFSNIACYFFCLANNFNRPRQGELLA